MVAEIAEPLVVFDRVVKRFGNIVGMNNFVHCVAKANPSKHSG